jgi:uncharacterized membrane protein YczE
VVRTALEALVMIAGFALGGHIGVGTVAFMVGIGPLVHITVARLAMPTQSPQRSTVDH